MKKNILFIAAILLFIVPIIACNHAKEPEKEIVTPNEEDEEEGAMPYDAPVAPATTLAANCISVQVMSKLDRGNYFTTNDYSAAVNKIKAKRFPLVFIEGCTVDYAVEPPYDNPIAEICSLVQSRTAQCFYFFMPMEMDQNRTIGCGILTESLITALPYTMVAGIPLSFQTFTPAATGIKEMKPEIGFFTVNTASHSQKLAEAFVEVFSAEKIVIGSIDKSEVEAWKQYLRLHVKDFRVAFPPEAVGVDRQLFVLSHVSYVFRECTVSSVSGTQPCYEIKIEKIAL